jgi:hypothetical protein
LQVALQVWQLILEEAQGGLRMKQGRKRQSDKGGEA